MEKQVAIIDDRQDVRERLLKVFGRHFEDEGIKLKLHHYPPLEDLNQYPEWIVHNKIVLLIVDEKLKENPISEGHFSSYDGHELVSKVREFNKEIPIYIITNHSEEEELNIRLGDYNDIIDRDLFDKDSNQFLTRIFRSTQGYITNFESEYARLSVLSEKSATNNIEADEVAELKALQAKLEIPLSSISRIDRTGWLNEMEEEVTKLQDLKSRIEEYLKED